MLPADHSPAESIPRWRTRVVTVVVVCIWLVLAGRLVQLQWLGRGEYIELADRQRSYLEEIIPRPGEIVDRRGRVLATSVVAQSLYIVPHQIENPWKFAQSLSQALDIDPDGVFEDIASHRQRRFLWIKRRLSDEQADQIRASDLPAGTWGFRDEYLRSYPQGRLAAHVLGMRDIDGRGRGGLEQSLDNVLGGQAGKRRLVRDARGRVIDVLDEVAQTPRPGQSVELTLDAVIQLHSERVLDDIVEQWKPAGASAIVLAPQTGDVLAMASRPTFNPNSPGQIPDAAWKNQAISVIHEPGSTFKPFVVAWALEQGLLDKAEVFNCENGEYRMGRRRLHDHHPYGKLSVTDILVKSSNIGMAKIGEGLTNAGLYNAAIAFGFGRKTAIELPGEVAGILRPLSKWNSYSTGSIPMGQELAVTPLQLITAHAALANGGRLLSPRLVQSRNERAPQTFPTVAAESNKPAVVSRAVDSEIAHWLVEVPMTEVVRRGTGQKGQIADYTVFGKTGTAQMLDPATGKYSTTGHVCSFLCGAPSENPQVLVLITVTHPTVGSVHYGGTVAAPGAATLLEKSLQQLQVPIEHAAQLRERN